MYHNVGGWGSFVNKVSHPHKLIVSWKYQDPSQSVMIQQVQHYESLRDESRYSDLFFKGNHRSLSRGPPLMHKTYTVPTWSFIYTYVQ